MSRHDSQTTMDDWMSGEEQNDKQAAIVDVAEFLDETLGTDGWSNLVMHGTSTWHGGWEGEPLGDDRWGPTPIATPGPLRSPTTRWPDGAEGCEQGRSEAGAGRDAFHSRRRRHPRVVA